MTLNLTEEDFFNTINKSFFHKSDFAFISTSFLLASLSFSCIFYIKAKRKKMGINRFSMFESCRLIQLFGKKHKASRKKVLILSSDCDQNETF